MVSLVTMVQRTCGSARTTLIFRFLLFKNVPTPIIKEGTKKVNIIMRSSTLFTITTHDYKKTGDTRVWKLGPVQSYMYKSVAHTYIQQHTVKPLNNGPHWEPKFCLLQRGVPNSGVSGIFPVGVVCESCCWAQGGCIFRAFLCCTLAGKASTTSNSANLTLMGAVPEHTCWFTFVPILCFWFPEDWCCLGNTPGSHPQPLKQKIQERSLRSFVGTAPCVYLLCTWCHT